MIKKVFSIHNSSSSDQRNFIVLVALCFLGLVVFFCLISCKGTWSVNNHTKINGVSIDTKMEYTDGSSGSDEADLGGTPSPASEDKDGD